MNEYLLGGLLSNRELFEGIEQRLLLCERDSRDSLRINNSFSSLDFVGRGQVALDVLEPSTLGYDSCRISDLINGISSYPDVIEECN